MSGGSRVVVSVPPRGPSVRCPVSFEERLSSSFARSDELKKKKTVVRVDTSGLLASGSRVGSSPQSSPTKKSPAKKLSGSK